MPNDLSLRFKRASLSVALVASVLCIVINPVFAQSKESNEGTTVQKNSDGSVEAYDEGETAQSEAVFSGDSGTMQKGYRAGTSQYQKKFSDGTTVKRNADGSIETWDEGETQHYSGGIPTSGSGGGHRKTTKRAKSTSSSKAKTSTAKAKVTTSSTSTTLRKRGDLLKATH